MVAFLVRNIADNGAVVSAFLRVQRRDHNADNGRDHASRFHNNQAGQQKMTRTDRIHEIVAVTGMYVGLAAYVFAVAFLMLVP